MASGNPLAYRIISALRDDRLMADPDTKKVYVKEADGKIIDAATGAPVDSIPDSAAAVRLNNRLRRTVEAALGGLTLQSPDPAARIQAAQSVFKTHDESMLPAVAKRARRSCCSSRTPPTPKNLKPLPPSRREATRRHWRC